MNNLRASMRSKEHSERNVTQRIHVKFWISLHSQEFCKVLQKNQLCDCKSLPADRVSNCVTTSRLWICFSSQNSKGRISEAARVLGWSFWAISIVLRKNLKFRAYRLHLTQCLRSANMESRSCTLWWAFEEEWIQTVIWSDEKWFVLKQSPNKQIYNIF